MTAEFPLHDDLSLAYRALMGFSQGAIGKRKVLERLPVQLDYREYDMGQTVSDESLADIVVWLERRLEVPTESRKG